MDPESIDPPVPPAASSPPRDVLPTGPPVVGVGASAGGLDAVTRLLHHLPPDPGFALVLVQHLSASHPSALSELLARATAMPVSEVVEATTVSANHLYVIPPNTLLTITDGVLHLAPRPPGATSLAIDHFLESLAADCGSRAVGVILSGTGSDGAAGLLAIREAGGRTFAQDPATAESPGMPRMAGASGGAEVVLSPEGIGAALTDLVSGPDGGLNRLGPHASDSTQASPHLASIYDVMHAATGIDFSLYRATTVLRRILRRLAARNLPDLESYAGMLASDGDERAELQRELLIGVTSFFRDPECFEAITTLVLPALFAARAPNAPIRIWVAGCATGEEAYSILMLLQEYQQANRLAFPVQMFASDLSETAIEVARAGRYSEAMMEPVSAERRRRHFTRVPNGFQINQDLREQCVFSRHNLLDDPPFSRLDLISCRNVLIYLDAVQRRIISLFHYALVDHGFLMLGRSEAVGHAGLFQQVDGHHRIYTRRAVAKRPYESFARIGAARRIGDLPVVGAPAEPRRGPEPDASRDADRIIASRFGPTAVVVDEDLEVLEVRGRSAPFLAMTAGKASLHLVKHLPDTALFLEVERLVGEARRTGDVTRAARVTYHDHGERLNLEVSPIRAHGRPAFLVLFESAGRADATGGSGPAAPVSAPGGDGGATPSWEELQRDVQRLRARLVELIEDRDARHEGTQQIAEDALSANEELQSLAEELETAKEELQSTNEELQTLNRELEARNRALVNARDLARATVETVGVPLLVVDPGLAVRHANAAFTRTFQLPAAGVTGQQLFEMCDGAWAIPDLRVRIESLLTDHRPFERVEISCELRPVGRRVLQISGCTLDDHLLVLLTIEDVTAQRDAELALRRSEEMRRQSEKMEVVGRLAGGIAHDFNNLLTVIIANADFMAQKGGATAGTFDHVGDIRRAAERAAALTDQLLSFSRRKVVQPRTFDLNALLHDFEQMLRRLLPEQFRIVVRTDGEPCLIKADPAEIGRVVMNLSVNARDAMPAGGTLTLQSDHVALDDAAALAQGCLAGPYVRLRVTDSGLGMSREIREHAFEPFYTTKEVSRGAGLGLSTVLGIVEESNGTIACESEPGQGTRFTILMPAERDYEEVETSAQAVVEAPPGRAERILLVEDDDRVRALSMLVLQRAGYMVIEASGGERALELMRSLALPLALLLTDVQMPDMGGGELARRAKLLQPDLKVMFVSGHADDVLVKEGIERGVAFLQKPFGPAQLTRCVRDVLDAPDV